jgi:hypothetical protein
MRKTSTNQLMFSIWNDYTNETIWLVLDEDYQVVEPIQQYLTSLSTSKSPNTVESYGHDLKLWWQFLEYKCLDWRNTKNEFVCPKCQTLGMNVWGIQKLTNKRQFWCFTCKKKQQESCQIDIRAIKCPTNSKVIWYTNHRIKGFICPECQAEQLDKIITNLQEVA